MIAYKIVEKTNDGFKFLFHNRKQIIRFGQKITAEKKMVYESYDKNGEKRLYLSGIHVIETKELCLKYLRRFKRIDNKTIIECEAIGCVNKPRGNPGVLLADEIIAISEI